jgi:hypothetical protein
MVPERKRPRRTNRRASDQRATIFRRQRKLGGEINSLKPNRVEEVYVSIRPAPSEVRDPKVGRLHLDQLDQTEVMDWLASKVAEGYAQAMVNRWQVILSHMLRMAKKWGLPGSERNPLEGVKQKECNNALERSRQYYPSS